MKALIQLPLSALVASLFILTGTAQAQIEVRVGMSDYPPLTITADWSGIFPDLLNEIFRGSPYQVTFTSVPYARGFHSLSDGSVDIGILAQRTVLAREGFTDEVDVGEPFFIGVSGFVYNSTKHPNLTMTKLSDLKGMTVKVVIGTLHQHFEDAGMIVSEASNVPGMLKMVEAQRTDLFYISDIIAIYLADSLFPETKDNLHMLYQSPPSILNLMLGISKKFSGGHEALRAHIDQRMRQMLQDGTYRKILDKYYRGRGQPELAIPYQYYGVEPSRDVEPNK